MKAKNLPFFKKKKNKVNLNCILVTWNQKC